MGLESERPSIGVDECALLAVLHLFADTHSRVGPGLGGLDTAAVERSPPRGWSQSPSALDRGLEGDR